MLLFYAHWEFSGGSNGDSIRYGLGLWGYLFMDKEKFIDKLGLNSYPKRLKFGYNCKFLTSSSLFFLFLSTSFVISSTIS
jgi:hypothetical protein